MLMRPAPESKSVPANLSLESFIEELLDLPPSDITSAAKNDAFKVFACLLFIRKHIDEICTVIEAYNDRIQNKSLAEQRYREFYTNVLEGQATWQRDLYVVGCLRDHEETSFHINNYKDAKEAKDNLLNQNVGHVEFILNQLTREERLQFYTQLRYDKNSGCLAARMEQALQWAQALLVQRRAPDSLLDIHKIISAKFSGTNNYGDINTFTANAIEYCKSQGYLQCIYNESIVAITKTVFEKYYQEFLYYNPDTEDKNLPAESKNPDEHLNTLFSLVDHYVMDIQNHHIDYYFKSVNEAQQFANQTKLDIKTNKGNYFYKPNVRLTKIDLEKLTGEKEFISHLERHIYSHRRFTIHRESSFLIRHAVINRVSPTSYLLKIAREFEDIRSNDSIRNKEEILNIMTNHFIELVKKLDSDTCDKAALLPGGKFSINDLSTFHELAIYLTPNAFEAFFKKTSVAARRKALLPENEYSERYYSLQNGGSILSIIAMHHSSDVFIEYIKHLDAPTCIKVALIHDEHNLMNNVFSRVIQYQTHEACAAFIAKLDYRHCKSSREIVAEGLITGRVYHWLSLLAEYQSSENFINFIEKLSEHFLNTYCDFTTPTLEKIIKHQSPDAVIQFISHISTEKLRKNTPQNPMLIKMIAEEQTHLACEKFLKILSPKNNSDIYKLNLTRVSDKDLYDIFSAYCLHQSKNNFLLFANLLDENAAQKLELIINTKISNNEIGVLPLAIGNKFNFSDLDKLHEEKSDIIFPRNGIERVLHLLFAAQQIAELKRPPEQKEISQTERALIETMRSGHAMIKIIGARKEHKWDYFLRQLEHPNYRPRDLRIKNEKAKKKLVHLTNTIVPTRSDEEQAKLKKNKKYTRTKKTSVTLISKHLDTPPYAQGVGFVFNGDPNLPPDLRIKIKAMFKSNAATVNQGWKNPKLHLYQKWISKINFTSYDEFKHHVENQPGIQNEALAQLSINALAGIIIYGNTVKNRETARKYHRYMYEKHGIDLPIIFYAPKMRWVYPYTKHQQWLDDLGQQLFPLQRNSNPSMFFVAKPAGHITLTDPDTLKQISIVLDPSSLKTAQAIVGEALTKQTEYRDVFNKINQLFNQKLNPLILSA